MSDGTTDDETSEESTQNDETQETESQATETEQTEDWQGKYTGQLKVNRDLEAKLKAATRAAKADSEAADLAKKPAEEQALEAARAEARTEATKAANARILKSELRAAATGKLADVSDALLNINLDDFDVNDDGDVDSDALNDAITDLLTRKPHLAAQKQNRFDGDADQGAKGKGSKPAQLAQSDLSRMSAAEIVAAQNAGQLNKLLGINS